MPRGADLIVPFSRPDQHALAPSSSQNTFKRAQLVDSFKPLGPSFIDFVSVIFSTLVIIVYINDTYSSECPGPRRHRRTENLQHNRDI